MDNLNNYLSAVEAEEENIEMIEQAEDDIEEDFFEKDRF